MSWEEEQLPEYTDARLSQNASAKTEKAEEICFMTSFLPRNVWPSLNHSREKFAQVSHKTGGEWAQVDATSPFPGGIVRHRRQRMP